MIKKCLEEVRQFFADNGCVLLSTIYKSNYEKLSFKCKCERVSEICFNQFCKSQQCRQCGIKQMKASKSKGQLPCRVCGRELMECDKENTMDRDKHGNICRGCYNKDHAVHQRRNGKRYYVKHHDKRIIYMEERRKTMPELVRKQSNDSYHKTRIEVLKHYSPKLCCVACGFDAHLAALSIDHVRGDGAKHRREIGQANIYYWLKKNCFPQEFQVLCMNCQFIKRYNNKESPGIQRKIRNAPSGLQPRLLDLAIWRHPIVFAPDPTFLIRRQVG